MPEADGNAEFLNFFGVFWTAEGTLKYWRENFFRSETNLEETVACVCDTWN